MQRGKALHECHNELTGTSGCAAQEVQHEIRAMRQSLQYLQMLVQADLEEVASFREVRGSGKLLQPWQTLMSRWYAVQARDATRCCNVMPSWCAESAAPHARHGAGCLHLQADAEVARCSEGALDGFPGLLLSTNAMPSGHACSTSVPTQDPAGPLTHSSKYRRQQRMFECNEWPRCPVTLLQTRMLPCSDRLIAEPTIVVPQGFSACQVVTVSPFANIVLQRLTSGMLIGRSRRCPAA